MQKQKVIFWDFDGTLAYRPRGWSGTMLDLLVEIDPATSLTREDFIRPGGEKRFPWDTPDESHFELSTPDLWWQKISGIIARVYMRVGVNEEIAIRLARQYRAKYLDLDGWIVYDDVKTTLRYLSDRGWRHVIVSNHVPELAGIVDGLDLGPLFDHVITSALVGIEKPHSEMFRIALEAAGNPDTCWMIGDNPDVDVLGAENVGIRGILVRRTDRRVARSCQSLGEIVDIVGDG